MRSALALVPFLAVTAGCAGVGGAIGSSCAAAAVAFAAEVCVDSVCSLCDSDVPLAPTQAEPPPEVPPPPAAAVDTASPPERLGLAACRRAALPGGTWRLDCADGTFAEALSEGRAASPLGDGDALVIALAGVEALAERRAVLGALRVSGSDLLRVHVPSLRHVAGELRIENAVVLRELRLPALHRVAWGVHITDNRALRTDPAPALATTASVVVRDNDALPTAVVDRLMALAPPP